jgi:hypothetical protein
MITNFKILKFLNFFLNVVVINLFRFLFSAEGDGNLSSSSYVSSFSISITTGNSKIRIISPSPDHRIYHFSLF